MVSHLVCEELSDVLDEVVLTLLADGQIDQPPVDALALARALGLAVAADDRQTSRARLVHLAGTRQAYRASILVRSEPRHERLQWAVAHELGESRCEHVFDRLGIDPAETRPGERERMANQLAGRLLLPRDWFLADARQCGWDLFALKARYTTASHELLARRMLDFALPVVITVVDNGRITLRKSNRPGRVPPPVAAEQACLTSVQATGASATWEDATSQVQAWAIHEPGWQREILRYALPEETGF